MKVNYLSEFEGKSYVSLGYYMNMLKEQEKKIRELESICEGLIKDKAKQESECNKLRKVVGFLNKKHLKYAKNE